MTPEAERALLERFEPIIRYTKGERFFPMEVDPYVRACSLWLQRQGEEPERLLPPRDLDLERLSEPRPATFGDVHFLQLTDPLTVAQMAGHALQEARQRRLGVERFEAGQGRLARVGLSSRFVDAAFSLTLFARGRVPGDAAAAASRIYNRWRDGGLPIRYYGRVVNQNDWLVLQYWYFYAFNNWRSGFDGANDHEGDWEMAAIYLAESGSDVTPEWVAYAAHNYQGADLRRRWDDPVLRREGEHPVIFAGAGSHASYFAPGEYLTEIELPFLVPLVRLTDRARKLWRKRLRQYAGSGYVEGNGESNLFRIPFVDYARGDGVSVGPGQRFRWAPALTISDPPAWITQYRGLWGLYARDPFAGEDAPAGPLYNRDGSPRRAWYDPVGWAGLDHVPPRAEAALTLDRRRIELQEEREELQRSILDLSRTIQALGVEAEAMRGQPHLARAYAAHAAQIQTLSAQIASLRATVASSGALLGALKAHESRLADGDWGAPEAHLQRAHLPVSNETLRAARLAELWAAASVGLTLIGVVLLFVFRPAYLGTSLAGILGLFVIIEAGFRGRLTSLITRVTLLLALAASAILALEFFWQIVTVGILLAGTYLLLDNLRELGR